MPNRATPTPVAVPTPLTCVIVEDQGMFLDLLSSMIAIRGGMRIAAQARDVAAGHQACAEHRPDVLILDLALPDGDGLDVAQTFLEASPHGRVLVVTGQASDFVCPAWLNDNLQAVISKNDAFAAVRRELDELTGTTKLVLAGDVAVESLSAREAEIFGLIGDGLSTRAIAERLGLSEHTVQTHRKRIALKLNTSGDETIRQAIAHRIKCSQGATR
jgi:DNA-binding NarL/FixJ family response regulator